MAGLGIAWLMLSSGADTSQNLFQGISSAEVGFEPLEWKSASVRVEDDTLIVSTGVVEGRWQWTGRGFVTSGFKHLRAQRDWVSDPPVHLADWDLRLFQGNPLLRSLRADISTDDGLTAEHLRVTAELDYDMPQGVYPKSGLRLYFEIWAYPGESGLRTQVKLSTRGQWAAPGIATSNDYRIDYLPLSPRGFFRQTVGFYNDHDGRNADDIEFVEDRSITTPFLGFEEYPRANMLFIHDQNGGVALVKESHKVINKPGVNTGTFRITHNGVESTGWGLALANLTRDELHSCWASWRICWDGGEEEKQLAIKSFDRMRFPIREPERVLTCNVWGGGQRKEGAKEANIMREIQSSADLGIDVVQIDAGWQDEDPKTPAWEPKSEAYPNGWNPIMKLAGETGVTLGIWTRAEDVLANPDKLNRLYDAGFSQFKIDIGSWSTYDYLKSLTDIVRDLKEHSNHQATVNWDVTHKGLRVGYLFNREYGNLFLQNRRLPMQDEGLGKASHTYVPRRILKDQWQAANYLNLNEIMFNVQTTEYIHESMSNAREYGDAYSFAIAMMSAPLFFTETWRYSEEDRATVRELIQVYKKHRVQLFEGFVFSIGAKPSDGSWTGFQNHQPGKDFGFLTIFRGIDNSQSRNQIRLRFLRNTSLTLEDLLNGELHTVEVDGQGTVNFKISEPAGFKFYRYTDTGAASL